jgi:hypothetical protein
MRIIGIDPGLTGGVAMLRDDGSLDFAEPMPVLQAAVATVDYATLEQWIDSRLHWYDGKSPRAPVFAYVERAQSMPDQGVSSAFNYGLLFGSVLTALAALDIGYELVSPRKWKATFGLDTDKRKSIALATQFYPQLAPLRAKDDGLAEAVLLARWGMVHGQGRVAA